MQGYSSFKGEEFFGMVALLVNDYMFMLILMIVAVIFNVLTKKTLSSKAFTVRTVSIVAALIAGLMSFPAMGMFAYIAIARYPQVAQITAIPVDIFTLTEVYTSPMTDWLIQRPYLFYMYFVSFAVFAVLVGTSLYTVIKTVTAKSNRM